MAIISTVDLSEGRVPCAICGQLMEMDDPKRPVQTREDGDGHIIWAAHGACAAGEEKRAAYVAR